MTRSSDPMRTPCADLTKLFYSHIYEDQVAAKALCQGCQLRPRCLERALETGDEFGIQGGYDPQERGYYKRLNGTRVRRVQDLPERFVTKPKRRKGKSAA